MSRETLRQKQSRFLRMTLLLMQYAHHLGYELTYADAYRDGDPRLHGKRLALDLNLFRNGVYLTKTSDHEPLGLFWESIGGSWGGRFNDGNHYSLAHGGQK